MSADLPRLRGRVAWIFDEPDYDVDDIVGIANIKEQNPDRLAALVLVRQDPAFRTEVRAGDLLVGGTNFGFGHPHYPPMIGMRRLGIAGVIAESFSPGYWRGEISQGFPQIACPGVLRLARRWDVLAVDWAACLVRNETQGGALPFDKLSDSDRRMIAAGGLIPFLKQAETET